MVFKEISNSLVKSKRHFVELGDSFMWLSLQLLEFHCFSQFPGYFVQLKVVIVLLIFGKLLEMLPLILEVTIEDLYSHTKALNYNHYLEELSYYIYLH